MRALADSTSALACSAADPERRNLHSSVNLVHNSNFPASLQICSSQIGCMLRPVDCILCPLFSNKNDARIKSKDPKLSEQLFSVPSLLLDCIRNFGKDLEAFFFSA